MKQMISKTDLIEQGFSPNTAKEIIKTGKEILVKKGFSLYANKRVSAIPITVASDIIGFEIKKES